jgi:hypothetical protein
VHVTVRGVSKEGVVKKMLGVNHVHVTPRAGRSFVAHVNNVKSVGVGRVRLNP